MNISDADSIDLSKIDWNCLSPEEFRNLNERLLKNQKAAKSQEHKKSRVSGNVIVKIRGKNYRIKQVDYLRLKTMKSDKSRNKLIDKIISENNPIETI